ncbi:hypothetical protein AAE478_009890 [Parahypoxylon ruwenzoriense]
MSSTVSDSDPDPGPTLAEALTEAPNPDIDVTARPAVAVWRLPDGQDQSLPHVNFDLHYNVRSTKAFFKLRAVAALKAQSRSHKTNVFLFIYPERIRTVCLEESPCAVEAKALGPDVICLRFDLSRAPDLVAPKDSLAPRNQASGKMLNSLRALSQQTTFAIYAGIPCRTLPRRQLRSLCEIASRGGLGSIAAHCNTASLYAGNGGRIIEGDNFRVSTVAAASVPHEGSGALEMPGESPPAYDQLPPNSQHQAELGSHKKRRRCSPEPVGGVNRKYIEDICAHMLDNRLAEMERNMNRQLRDLETRILDYVDESLAAQRRDIMDDIGDKIEDEYYGVKVDLQSYIREEIEESESRFMDQLSHTSISLQFNT